MVDARDLSAVETLLRDVAEFRSELGAVIRRIDSLASTVERLARRNLVPLDDELMGVSSRLGWLIVPREEYRTLLHLSNGMDTHEVGTVTLLKALVRPGDTVIDVGAHIGLLALPIARMVGPEGCLIALEPNKRSAECLRRTLLSNGTGNQSHVIEVAASDENALVDYYIGPNSMLGSLIMDAEDQPSVKVKSARIDDIIPDDIRIDLVKIDVEGFEIQAIRGMESLIHENRDIFIIAEFGPSHLKKYGTNSKDWFDVFFSYGLNCFLEIDGESGACSRSSIEDLEKIYSANLLFYRHDNRRQDALLPLLNGNRSA